MSENEFEASVIGVLIVGYSWVYWIILAAVRGKPT